MDDRRARSVAKQLGSQVIGTIGILVNAKRSGVVPLLKPVLDALDAAGFYASAALKKEALQVVGE